MSPEDKHNTVQCKCGNGVKKSAWTVKQRLTHWGEIETTKDPHSLSTYFQEGLKEQTVHGN